MRTAAKELLNHCVHESRVVQEWNRSLSADVIHSFGGFSCTDALGKGFLVVNNSQEDPVPRTLMSGVIPGIAYSELNTGCLLRVL